jgi:hypothetical protein
LEQDNSEKACVIYSGSNSEGIYTMANMLQACVIYSGSNSEGIYILLKLLCFLPAAYLLTALSAAYPLPNHGAKESKQGVQAER